MRRGKPLRRTPLKRTEAQLRRTRLKPVSERREAGRDAYEDAKAAVWARDRGQCQAERRWPEVACGGRLDPHHVWPQGLYPERRCDPDAMLVVCRRHHDHIHHVDPRRARELELLI